MFKPKNPGSTTNLKKESNVVDLKISPANSSKESGAINPFATDDMLDSIDSEHPESFATDDMLDSIDSEHPFPLVSLPESYDGKLFFYLDVGTGTFYSVYSHPYHIVRKFWKEDTENDYEGSSQDAVTWLYHQIDQHPMLPESNKYIDKIVKGTGNLNDLSLTYLAESAMNLPGTIVGYANDADEMTTILSPIVDDILDVCENTFRYSNSNEATQNIVRIRG